MSPYKPLPEPTALDLADLWRTLRARFGADHPLTQRALSDARHAGADWLGIEPAEPAGIWKDYAYRGVAGETVGLDGIRPASLADHLPSMIAARAAAES